MANPRYPIQIPRKKVALKEIVVSDPLDLTGDLNSDVVYLLDGVIDMGAVSIVVPETGLNIAGIGSRVAGLVTSEASHTLFVVPSGSFSGFLMMSDMFIRVDGVGSQVFDLDNQGNQGDIETANFNFLRCTSLGEVANYQQVSFITGFALLSSDDGLTLSGTMDGGIAVFSAIVTDGGTPFPGTILKAGTLLTIAGSVRSDMNALGIADTAAICDFAPANILANAGFQMTGVRVNHLADAFPNMPPSSVKAIYSLCTGTQNTYRGGEWHCSTSVETVIAAANTPVKVAGATTYRDLHHTTGAVSNALTYIGTDEISIIINATVSFTGTTNNVINVLMRLWDDSASAYVDISESGGATLNAGGRAEDVALVGTVHWNTNDRIELWVENQTAAQNVTMAINGQVIASER